MPRKAIPPGTQVAPSLLAADFAHLADEVAAVSRAGARILHLDVMDGQFVANITFGPPLVAAVRAASTQFLDTHLMIRDPLKFLDSFAQSGADLLTLHAEALGSLVDGAPTAAALATFGEAHEKLLRLGCRMGLSFRPATDPGPWLERVGSALDLVLIMTVEPGFGGQSFLSEQLERVRSARALRDARGWDYRIEVDGGIGLATIRACVAAGAEILVAGTAVFGPPDRGAALAALVAVAGG